MLIKVCAIYDRKTRCYERQFFIRFLEEALREWELLLTKKETKYGSNPEDFEMYLIGEFDDESGELIPMKPMQISGGQPHANTVSAQ